MPTYAEIIPRLSNELRDEEAWPDNTSKVDEQINLLYVAALAIAREVSLNRLSISISDPITGSVIDSAIKAYPLPDDIFDLRYPPKQTETMVYPGDMGISKLRLDGRDYLLAQALSVHSLLHTGNQQLYRSRPVFALDFDGNQIYATNVTEFKLRHVPKPQRPTNQDPDNSETDYKVLDWPLQNDSDTQRAVHIVAAHVSGVTIKDPAASQFQSLLTQLYNV